MRAVADSRCAIVRRSWSENCRPKSSSVGGEHGAELQRVRHDHQRRIGVVHRGVDVPVQEANGVLVPGGLEGHDRDAHGKQKFQGQRGRRAAPGDEVAGLGDDGFSR